MTTLGTKLLRIVAWCVTPLVVEVCVGATRTHIWKAPPTPVLTTDSSGLQFRMYDVRDLIMYRSDFQDHPDFDPPPSSFDLLIDRWSPANWSVLGFTCGERSDRIVRNANAVGDRGTQQVFDSQHPAIKELSGQLLARQSKGAHARIAAMLNRLRFYQWLFRNSLYYFFPWIGMTVLCRFTKERVFARAIAEGCCAECGYDLRETPQRCPECGAAPGSSDEATPTVAALA